jgi:endonuclease/exonuclease/phosphatase family metal-dependent hydrolase
VPNSSPNSSRSAERGAASWVGRRDGSSEVTPLTVLSSVRIVPRLLLAAAVATGLACATAQNYLDPEEPLYEGSYAPPPESSGTPPRALRVVTFNIEKGGHAAAAAELLRSRPQLAAPDVVFLQEMRAPGVEEMARALRLNYVYCPASHHTKEKRDIGNAVLSPWPIEARWKVVLPHLSRFSHHARSVVGARLRRGDGNLRVYSLHLGTPINLSGKQRREQLEAVVEDAKGSPDPVLVAGDFNAKSLAEWLSDQGFAWPTRDVGKTSTFFGASFDHILFRGLPPSMDVTAGVVRDLSPGISDHYPVWATFTPR